ncbi:hypothetical protein JUJ52_03295 [Virgibacillus sp. AGTR]|uniref:hypothetical protein n=1 Tax=Virgibacillus sp. AGTR TaxID=2812055 RepID=UPI001D16EEEC|nr:hypothetical protein [Virgibacillus sp. AGTR]MCC2248983.1 hypothetical protein [Virgibacillus sp. AGTR]
MSKHFAMLNAVRRLENHLSREDYILNKMAENNRISFSLFEKKVSHYNELVDTLNDLFASLIDSPSSQLFSRYVINSAEGSSAEETEVLRDIGVVDESEEDVTYKFTQDETDELDEPEEPAWKTEGYETYDTWLTDKEAEYAQSSDDLSLGVNDAMSRHRAGQALDEYNETSERDIASYLPEDDSPVNVLPSDDIYNGEQENEDESSDEEISATDYNYLDHTVDNVRVDNDPTQIAGVETAVERYGETARQGTDIDVSSFMYQSESSVVNNLISDDIKELHAKETVLSESDV